MKINGGKLRYQLIIELYRPHNEIEMIYLLSGRHLSWTWGPPWKGVVFFLEADLATFLVAAGADIVKSDLRIESLIIYKLEGKKNFY